jgi:hypothetical protein
MAQVPVNTDIVRPFAGVVNEPGAWRSRSAGKSAKLVKGDLGVRSRKNDRKSFHADAAALLDKSGGG